VNDSKWNTFNCRQQQQQQQRRKKEKGKVVKKILRSDEK
jgi:hypothetical protein